MYGARTLLAAQRSIVSAGFAYATWDPTHTGSNLVLSNANLTVTAPSGINAQFARATLSIAADLLQWEITINAIGGSGLAFVGIALAGSNYNTAKVGDDASSWSYEADNGDKRTNATDSAYGSTYGTGAVVGVYLDAINGNLGFLLNGVDQGLAFSGLTGPFYPAFTPYNSGQGTANFGPTLQYPKSGYTPGPHS